MTNFKNSLIVLFLVSVLMMVYCFETESDVQDKNLVSEYTLLSENEPVYLSGCRTYQRPKAIELPIYPTVRRNFVARLCALEVFPSNGLIAVQDLNVGKVLEVKTK